MLNVESKLQQAKTSITELITLNQNLEGKVKKLEDENIFLFEMIRELKRARFGKKSEKWESTEQVAFVFNEAETEAKKPEEDDADTEQETILVKAHTKKRGHRKPLPANLPREVVKIELPSDEQYSEDGTPLKVIGWEISEKLSYTPAKTTIIEYHRAKYGIDAGDYIKTAPPVPCIIPKGIVTPELLAGVIVNKYCDGLPLYRQEEIFKRQGIDISRSTMGRWIVQASEACVPLINLLSDRLSNSSYISCDETHTQVLHEPDRRAEAKSWMWVRATPYGKNRIILFDYDPSRSSEVVKKLFTDYKGTVQVDGYKAYNILHKSSYIKRIGCNMHGRRYFEKARTIGAKDGQSLGAMGLKFYKILYQIEEDIKNYPPDERHKIRQEKAVLVWQKFKAWADEAIGKVPPKSKIGQALQYFTSEYKHLIGYLADGHFEMDNGFIERAIRKFAIGRNNWLFSDTIYGAHASSLFYSLAITAKINGVNPYAALKYIFAEIPKAKTIEDFDRLVDIIVAISPIPCQKG